VNTDSSTAAQQKAGAKQNKSSDQTIETAKAGADAGARSRNPLGNIKADNTNTGNTDPSTLNDDPVPTGDKSASKKDKKDALQPQYQQYVDNYRTRSTGFGRILNRKGTNERIAKGIEKELKTSDEQKQFDKIEKALEKANKGVDKLSEK